MRLSTARGIILEELVLYLLELVGYRIVRPGDEGTRIGHSGLEVRGRGEWHQIDALAAFDFTPAFMYPLRLMVEAKCYARGRPVGIEIARNSVGVLKDISENYFSYQPIEADELEVQVRRFNYLSAIFSTSGYTSGAQRFAIAHQIFLIQYEKVHLLEPVVDGLLLLGEEHLDNQDADEGDISARLRRELRSMLRNPALERRADYSVLTEPGFHHVRHAIVAPLLAIRGSYFGMLQGRWPMHLLARSPLPAEAFVGRDVVQCKVYGRETDRWSFSPVDVREGERGWFRLEFDIPEEIVGFVREAREDPIALAQMKRENFSFLDLVGKIGGIQRQVKLRLDDSWFEFYLDKIRARRR